MPCSAIATVYSVSIPYALQHQPKDVAHLFPFIGPEESSSEIRKFYRQIHKILIEVHNTQNNSHSSQHAIGRLITLTKER